MKGRTASLSSLVFRLLKIQTTRSRQRIAYTSRCCHVGTARSFAWLALLITLRFLPL